MTTTPELLLDSPHTPRQQPTQAASSKASSTVEVQLSAEALNVSMAIGADDVVEGKIRIGKNKSLVIRGTVSGEIISQGTVIVVKGGRVLGKITAASLMTEGDIGDTKSPAILDVGVLHIGADSRTVADCTYDTMCVETPNRGIRGQMQPRSEMEASDV